MSNPHIPRTLSDTVLSYVGRGAERIKRISVICDTHYLWVGYVIIGVFTVAYCLLVLHRYWQFQYFFTDNVYFQKAFWDMARLQAPIVDHKYLGRIHILGDHFSPTMFLLVIPLWLGLGSETMQLAMIIPYALSMILALHVGGSLIRTKSILIFIIIVSFLYLGFQHAMIFGFHEIHIMPFFFWMMVWAFFRKRHVLYWISILALLLTKESMPFVLAGWGLFVLFSQNKRYRSHALILITLSVTYFLLITMYVIPHLGGRFLYVPVLHGGLNVGEAIRNLFTPAEKVKTFVVTILSFGMLPIAQLAVLPLVLQDFATRYIFSIPGNTQYMMTFHYGIALTPVLVFASIWSVHRLQDSRRWILTLMCVVAVISTLYAHLWYMGRGPLQQVLIPDFYKVTADNAFLWDLVEHVPKEGAVMTMNHLGFALADRDVYQITPDTQYLSKVNPLYIVYDTRPGQSPANFLPFMSYEDFMQFIKTLESSPRYKTIYKEGTCVILKRV